MDSCTSGGCPSCAAAARPVSAPPAAASPESRAETHRAFAVFGVAAFLWAAGFVLTLLALRPAAATTYPTEIRMKPTPDGGVEVIADTNVPLDPNVHQAIAMVESEDVAAGNVLAVMQKGYTLNGRTIRAAMVTVAKAK